MAFLPARNRVLRVREEELADRPTRHEKNAGFKAGVIALGSYLLKKMENEQDKEKILAELNEYLTEDRDRKLFNL